MEPQDYQLRVGTAPAEEPVGTAEMKLHLRVNHTNEDAEIAKKIVSARKVVEDWIGRSLVNTTWDLYLDRFPPGTDEILIPRPPLVSVSHVKYYDEAGTEQTFAGTNYFTDTFREPGLVRLVDGAAWPATHNRRPSAVNVRFVGGYGTAGTLVDERARDAIKQITAALWANREADLEVKVDENPRLRTLLFPLRAWMA